MLGPWRFETVLATPQAERFPRRASLFPEKILAWFAGGGGYGRYKGRGIDYAQSDTFHNVTHLADRRSVRQHKTEQPPFILNDLTVDTFMHHLKITLHTWVQRPLDDQLAQYREQQNRKKR